MIIFGARKNFLRNGSFTVKDFRLYDKTSSPKGRSPAAHIAQTSRASQLPSSLPKEKIARWRQMSENACLPVRRRTRSYQ